MLAEVFKQLDEWIGRENAERRAAGIRVLDSCDIRILGQTALIEAHVSLYLFATNDVDAFLRAEYPIQAKFDELLRARGKYLDSDSSLIWMPEETEYKLVFSGEHVKGWIAEAEYVLLSKALKAPEKNLPLIQEYLAKGASEKFFKIAEKHHLDLERFL